MKPLFLDEIKDCMRARALGELPACSIYGVTTDSRRVGAGQLFIAIKGEHFDGHDFVSQAFQAGASAAVISRPVQLKRESDKDKLLLADDTVRALQRLASYYRDEVAGTVIAVTGSNGKTTTREMIHHVLGKRQIGTRSPKSFNNHIGVPLTLLSIEPSDQYAVVEVGSNHRGEIESLAMLIRPDVAVITNVGESHLAGLGSIEAVASEKASLVKYVRPGGLGVVNADESFLLRLISNPQMMVVSFGRSEAADLRITDLVSNHEGTRFVVNRRFVFYLPVPGSHNAVNALAAIAVGRRVGMSMGEVAEALADFKLPQMRLEVHHFTGVTVINDAYNANPRSMAAGLEVLESFPGRRKVFVCGQMLELGEKSARYHRQLGQRIGCSGVGLLLAVGPEAREVLAGAVDAGLNRKAAFAFKDVEEAWPALPQMLGDGDVVLLKGSRAMQLDRLLEPIEAAFGRAGKQAE